MIIAWKYHQDIIFCNYKLLCCPQWQKKLCHTADVCYKMNSFFTKGLLDLLANRCLAQGTNAWTATDHTCYTIETAGSEGFINMLPIYLDHVLYATLTVSTILDRTSIGWFAVYNLSFCLFLLLTVFVCLSLCLFVCLKCLSIYLSICLFITFVCSFVFFFFLKFSLFIY